MGHAWLPMLFKMMEASKASIINCKYRHCALVLENPLPISFITIAGLQVSV
jgi:hypothetical protein